MRIYKLARSEFFLFTESPKIIIHIDETGDIRGKEFVLQLGSRTIPLRLQGVGVVRDKLALHFEFDASVDMSILQRDPQQASLVAI